MVPSKYGKRTTRRFIAGILGSALGILFALKIPITFIPKHIFGWVYLHFFYWIVIGILIAAYIESYLYSKRFQKVESGIIEDEMDLEIIKASNKELGVGILSFDGNTLSFRGVKRGIFGLKDKEILLYIESKDILNLRAEIMKEKVLRSKVESGGTIIITTRNGLEYRFSNQNLQYHHYGISKWFEYLSHPEILKKKVDLNLVNKCRYCGTLLERNNSYCPNCLRHRCPVCDEWLEKKESICPYCEDY